MTTEPVRPQSAGLKRRLERVEVLRQGLLNKVEALPPEWRAAHPISGKWSILQIIEHLVLAEEAVLADLGSDIEGQSRSLRHRVLYWLVMLILRFDIPVRVPSRSMKPRGGTELADLRRRWDDSQLVLRRTIEGLGGPMRHRPLARHPIAGPMTAGQALAMLEVHLVRHIRQVDTRIELLSAES